jgi:hypothetical protein
VGRAKSSAKTKQGYHRGRQIVRQMPHCDFHGKLLAISFIIPTECHLRS